MKDFMTKLQQVAAAHHELYQEHVKAGFTEDQALEILLTIIELGFKAGGDDD